MKRNLSYLLFLTVCAQGIQGQIFQNATPGISGTIDYSNFNNMREDLVANLLYLVDGMELPDMPIGNDSYFRQNTIYMSMPPDALTMQPVPD
jgi:hypothetical protein